MLRLSDALSVIISENPLLQMGLSHRLLNLTQTAKYLAPLIEVRTKKKIQSSALLMALSRLQKSFENTSVKIEDYSIQHLSIQANLMTCTFAKEKGIRDSIMKLYAAIDGFFSISESTAQITIILEASDEGLVKKHLCKQPMFTHEHITAIGIRFDESYIKQSGFIAVVLQQLMLQGINLVEVASTYTELIVYVDDADAKLAFETLYGLFGV